MHARTCVTRKEGREWKKKRANEQLADGRTIEHESIGVPPLADECDVCCCK